MLWVDALRTNQTDDEEKGLQISRMGQIYKNANRVLDWLDHDNKRQACSTFYIMLSVNKCLDTKHVERQRHPPAMSALRGSSLGIDKEFGPGLISRNRSSSYCAVHAFLCQRCFLNFSKLIYLAADCGKYNPHPDATVY